MGYGSFDGDGYKKYRLPISETRAAPVHLIKDAGIDNFHFHDLRHTFTMRHRAMNVHEYDFADLLDHSTAPCETRNIKVTRD